ncbi:hypothetical protein BDR07DRAFT_1315682, partial [Suillus spraguei]
DPATGLLVITSNQYSALGNLNFKIDGVRNLHSHPNAQIWPRAISALIGGQQDLIYPIVRDIGARIGEGHYDFVNGYVSMQRFYTVFDVPAPQLPRRFSETEFTPATTN